MTTHVKEMPMDAETIAAWQEHFTTPLVIDTKLMTCNELAEKFGTSPATMRRRLAAGVKAGTVVVSTGYRVKENGVAAQVPVYKLVKPPAKKPKPKVRTGFTQRRTKRG